MNIDRPKKAIPHFLKALELAPEDTYTLCSLSSAYYDLDKYQTGLYYADRAVQSNPEEEWGYRCRSCCLQEIDREVEALEAAKEAVRLAPEEIPCLSQLADCQIACDRLKDAKITAEKMLELAPDRANTHIILGQIGYLRGRLSEAEVYLRKALELDPNSSEARRLLGQTLKAARRELEALNLFHEALLIDPESDIARSYLDVEVREAGFASITEYLNARSDPELISRARQVRQWKEQVVELIQQNKPEQAMPLLLQAHSLVPDNLLILNLLSQTSWQQGDMTVALGYADRMIQVAPKESLGYWRRGTILLAMSEDDEANKTNLIREALSDAETAIRITPYDPDYLILLSWLQWVCGIDAE